MPIPYCSILLLIVIWLRHGLAIRFGYFQASMERTLFGDLQKSWCLQTVLMRLKYLQRRRVILNVQSCRSCHLSVNRAFMEPSGLKLFIRVSKTYPAKHYMLFITTRTIHKTCLTIVFRERDTSIICGQRVCAGLRP